MVAMGACSVRTVRRRHCCEELHVQRARLCTRMLTMILFLSHLFLVCIYDVQVSQCIYGGQRPTWRAGPLLLPCWRQAFLLSTVFTRLAHLEAISILLMERWDQRSTQSYTALQLLLHGLRGAKLILTLVKQTLYSLSHLSSLPSYF